LLPSEVIRLKCKQLPGEDCALQTCNLTMSCRTIFGESAGATAVGLHAIAYGGKDEGLFSGIIGQSGNPMVAAYNATVGQRTFDNITDVAGCGDEDDKLSCLRGKDFDTLNTAFNRTGIRFGPAPDGDFIPNSTYGAVINGDFVKVPYMIGANSDEGTSFGPVGINNDSDFRRYLLQSGLTEDSAPIIEATYPDIPAIGIPATLTWTLNSSYGYQFKRGNAFGGDLSMHAGRRLTNQQYANYNVTTYSYRFNTIPYPLPNYIGVAHFQEVAFVFDNTDGLGYAANAKPFTDVPESYFYLAQLMSSMWASFIATGDPNNHKMTAPHWPVYTNGPGGDPVTGAGGYGKNMVLQANDTGSYVEDDTYRATGIAALNQMWGTVFGR
jgi:carboxylesterase type B